MWSLVSTQLYCSSKVVVNKTEMREHGCWPIRLPLQNQVASRSGLWSVHRPLLCRVSGRSGMRLMAKLKRSLLYTGTFAYLSSLNFLHTHNSSTEPPYFDNSDFPHCYVFQSKFRHNSRVLDLKKKGLRQEEISASGESLSWMLLGVKKSPVLHLRETSSETTHGLLTSPELHL